MSLVLLLSRRRYNFCNLFVSWDEDFLSRRVKMTALALSYSTWRPIRKASLFARERKRDSEEEVLLKMADLGGGRHPVSAVRSKQLTRRAFWADPTIHYFSQVAVESREGSEELTIAQAHCLGGPDNSLLGPGRRGIS